MTPHGAWSKLPSVVAVALLLGLLAAGGCLHGIVSPPTLPPAGDRWEVPLADAEAPHLYLPAEINGRVKGFYILDTGATQTSLDLRWARLAGVEPRSGRRTQSTDAHGVESETENGVMASLRLGSSLPLSHVPCALVQRRPETYAGQPVLGLLGMNVLYELRMTLDFDRGVVVFERNTGPLRAPPPGATTVKLRVEDGSRPQVQLELDGKRREFLLDTGAPNIYIDDRLGQSLGLKLDRSITGVLRGVQSRVRVNGVYRVQELRMGTLVYRDRFLWPLGSDRYVPSWERSGLAGLDLLAGYNAVLDFRTERLHLVTREPVGEPRSTAARVARWANDLPGCGPRPLLDCLEPLPAREVQDAQRRVLPLRLRDRLDRPVRLIVGLGDGQGRLAPSSHWISMVLAPGGPRVLGIPLPTLPPAAAAQVKLPEVEVGQTRLVIIDASPLTAPCTGRPVCLGLQPRRH